LAIAIREIAMLRQPSRSPHPQLELFPTKPPLPQRAAPLWTTLPEQTQHALTGLMTRMLIAHASAVPPNGEGGGDDV
jgi:hypothetical protein